MPAYGGLNEASKRRASMGPAGRMATAGRQVGRAYGAPGMEGETHLPLQIRRLPKPERKILHFANVQVHVPRHQSELISFGWGGHERCLPQLTWYSSLWYQKLAHRFRILRFRSLTADS